MAPTFTEALEQAARLATQSLPATLHARIADAVILVRDGRCFQTDDGTWQVDSVSTSGKTYSPNGTCVCHDVHYNQPPRGLCKHRLSVYLARKVAALMQVHADVTEEPTVDQDYNCNLETQPLYEAPCSLNAHLVIDGVPVQLTLRGHEELAVLARLKAVLAQYPQPQPAPQAASQGEGYCAKHGVPMKWNDGKEGRKGWYSHKSPDGQWCKGR